ncbi:hypothetical protein HPT25_07215 [Bacillus sp. BRMEA1]|uniref:hypothetical protein n=1 Tax=Neobacillus endophyticus TaxID=2738405 RepID=UPI0015662C73|nr:hypothetical protein [Neobacillus endophyticus]NRD77286.1 hypothetical protein [Neobacillus endophyticus]
MFKKMVGSLVAVSTLSVGLGLTNMTTYAASWDQSSLSQNQTSSGSWASLYQAQTKSVTGTDLQVNGSNSDGQGQTSFVTGTQLQSGKSDGAATATQSEGRTVDVGQSGSAGTQATYVCGSPEQSTSVSSPSYVLQSQTNTHAVFQAQGSIKGGPSIQGQILQGHSYQFSTAISKP